MTANLQMIGNVVMLDRALPDERVFVSRPCDPMKKKVKRENGSIDQTIKRMTEENPNCVVLDADCG